MSSPSPAAEVAVPQQPKPPVPLVGQLNDLDQAYRYAQALAQSSLLPKDLIGKPANVLTIMLYGQQLGLTPMQAVQSIYVVNGRPSMSGQLWLSKVREAGHKMFIPCVTCGFAPDQHTPDTGHRYESDHTEQRCTVTIVRKDTGEQHSETFTWAEGERAGLTRKDVWKSWPKRMLLWRAVSNCATVICPEVAQGWGAEDEVVEPVRPTLAQVAAERTDQVVTEPVAPVVDEAADEAAMLAEIRALEQQHDPNGPMDAELVDDGGMFAAPESAPTAGERL
ncbi:hypothetical protein [Saccharothrix stipae]